VYAAKLSKWLITIALAEALRKLNSGLANHLDNLAT
jgi:hypothetical protein